MAEHDWEDLPLRESSVLRETMDVEGRSVDLHVDIEYVFQLRSRRRCRRCGSESYDGSDAPEDCDVAAVRSTMES